MNPYRLIQKKRDAEELTAEEIAGFFGAYGEGELPDYQMAAFLMATYFRGLSSGELHAVVRAITGSGKVLDLSHLSAPAIDKHSSGGVGDKASLVLAPLVSSLGVPVPMMSGRGLGHTGGTADKLESIPGFRTKLSLEEIREQLERLGCALVSQSEEIAPLDRRLYALRDVTGTVESIPLIASSIMGKKLAEGLSGLVLDVKRGGGAFLPDLDQALELAHTMIAIGTEARCKMVALLTAMDRPLGYAVGNALEVEEALLCLQGEGPADLRDLSVALAGEMLLLAGAADGLATARAGAEAALDDGRALAQMRSLVASQGGNPAVVDDPALLPQAPVRRTLESHSDGWIRSVDARAIGEAAVVLGAGRTRLGDAIDPAVGFHITAKPGSRVAEGEPLATVFARTVGAAETALSTLAAAIELAEERGPQPLPLISHRVTATGVEEAR